jgi:hypothetical protein
MTVSAGLHHRKAPLEDTQEERFSLGWVGWAL